MAGPRLETCILLAGGLVPSPLAKLTQRMTLELWLTAHESLRRTPRVSRVWDLLRAELAQLV